MTKIYSDLRLPYLNAQSPFIQLGAIFLKDRILPESPVNLTLKTFNRHGLISGATGSGKTKTIQVLVEQLSLQGIPSFVMDIKGDISGLAVPGENNPKMAARNQTLNLGFKPQAFPVELLTLESDKEGVPIRATVQDFGPLLFSRMLDLNDTQTGVITILFEYAKKEKLSIIDLADLRQLLQFLQTEEGSVAIDSEFGHISRTSVGTILRKLIELESQGGNDFFGEPSFNVLDLLRTNSQGLGIASIVRLLDLQKNPKMFSTCMLKLLTDVYHKMPECGDLEKPKLVMFIDEAHLIFKEASKALLDLLNTIVKLIRSKGVGLIFCTQSPEDVPEEILSQLGLKIQHALRAFTAKDRKAIKLMAQNFPLSDYYKTEQLLTELGIGEALVSGLDAKGQPTPLVECLIRAPESRMGILTEQEIAVYMSQSELYQRYKDKTKSSAKKTFKKTSQQRNGKNKNTDLLQTISKNTLFRQIIRQVFRDLTRTLLSLLGGKRRK